MWKLTVSYTHGSPYRLRDGSLHRHRITEKPRFFKTKGGVERAAGWERDKHWSANPITFIEYIASEGQQ